MKVICLTGGLASGKSTAAKYLEEKGASIIDADKLGHRVYDVGTQAYREVIETFGEDIVADNNEIDRKALGSKVFGQPDELRKLTGIVWPEIRRLAELEMAGFEAMNPEGIVILEAAVLFEAGWDSAGEEVWVVVVDRDVAIDRAMIRDGMDRETVEKRLDAQLSNEARIERADVVIENNGEPGEMLARLDEEWARLTDSQ